MGDTLNPSPLVLSKNETVWVWPSFVLSHALRDFYDLPLTSVPFFCRASPEPIYILWPTLLAVCLCTCCMVSGRAKLMYAYSPAHPSATSTHAHLWSADQLHLALHGRGCRSWKGHPPAPSSLSTLSHNIYALLSCVTCMWRPAYQRTRCLDVLLQS